MFPFDDVIMSDFILFFGVCVSILMLHKPFMCYIFHKKHKKYLLFMSFLHTDMINTS